MQTRSRSSEQARPKAVCLEARFVALAPVLTPLQEIVVESLAFLGADSLETAAGYFRKLEEFAATNCGKKNVFSFLLGGFIPRAFSLTVRLKELVTDVLLSKFCMPVDDLSSLELTSHRSFSFMRDDDKDLICHVGACFDRMPEAPSFLLVDSVSVSVFVAIYILGEECSGTLTAGFLKDDFLGEYLSAIVEVSGLDLLGSALTWLTVSCWQHVYMYAQYAHAMSAFLNHQVASSRLDPDIIRGIACQGSLDERAVFVSFLGDMLPSNIRVKLDKPRKEVRRAMFESTVSAFFCRLTVFAFVA